MRKKTEARLKKLVLAAARHAAVRFAYYDRKEDEGLSPEDLGDAFQRGVVTVDEVAAAFREGLEDLVP